MKRRRLSSEAIEEFKEIYFKENGIMLSDKDADEYAHGLFHLALLSLEKTPNSPKHGQEENC